MSEIKSRKQRSREKIVSSAARLFTRHGFDNISIDDLMVEAGMTRGAFYSHFKDKSSLYAEAIMFGAMQGRLAMRGLRQDANKNGLGVVLEVYLSREHIDHEASPCPLAFLSTDISQRDPVVRDTYTRIYAGMVKRMQHLSPSDTRPSRETLLAVTAMMIGGVAIARALNDEHLADELLIACQQEGIGWLESHR